MPNIYKYTTLQYNFEFETVRFLFTFRLTTIEFLMEHGGGLDECICAHVII